MRHRHGFGGGPGRGFEEDPFDGRHGGRMGRTGGRMGGRGRRLFDQGDLRLVVLFLIGETSRHGYELIREIEARTGGLYAPSPGVIYPTLTLLEELGFITQQVSDGARKLFAITDAGNAELAREAHTVALVVKRMAATGSGQADGAPVFRAIHNLKMAVRGRLMRGGTDQETILAAAALLDEAAAKIERL